MSKEVEWGVIHGEGTINCLCDNCGAEEAVDFDDGYPDFRMAQAQIEELGWLSTKVHGEWKDFCCERCRNQYIKENA